MSFHVYQSGKILREVVYSDQINVAQPLGIPVQFGLAPLSWPPTPASRRNLRH